MMQIKSNTWNVNINKELNKNSNFKIIAGILIKFISRILVKYRNFPNSISWFYSNQRLSCATRMRK